MYSVYMCFMNEYLLPNAIKNKDICDLLDMIALGEYLAKKID